MTIQQATMQLAAAPQDIRRVLLDPLALPQWNEAFQSVAGPAQPAVGVEYKIAVRPGLSGTWEYTAIEPDRVEATWKAPGFREQGAWTFQPRGSGTLVTHGFQHAGPLAALLRNAYKGVAELRLRRLSQRLAAVGG
jgi:uncharacterized protein YndB with AHSA1/START domain